MQLANVRVGDAVRLAEVGDDGVLLLEGWGSLDDFLNDPAPLAVKQERLRQAVERGQRQSGNTVAMLSPVLRPGKIICIGLNYRRHAEETGSAIPTVPVVFSKFSDSVAAHCDLVRIPRKTQEFDYEAELAIIIGARTEAISESRALEAVLGYCNANDFSARDLQHRTSQWLLGKTGPGMAPLGPFARTADTIADPNALSIRTWRNGSLVQDSNTSDMIFSCAEIIAYLSWHFPLQPGDVILTGTPEGVILGQPEGERRWLQSGDRLTVGIEGLGELENTVTAD